MTFKFSGLGIIIQSLAERLQHFWQRHQIWIMPIAIAILALLSAARLSEGFYRLIQEPQGMGAVDLKLRYHEVQGWFAGQPVYEQSGNAIYPPASYAVLSPLYLLRTESLARWVWAGVCLLGLVIVCVVIARECSAQRLSQKLFLVLLFTAHYSTSFAIGNGQLVLLVLPCLVVSLLLLKRIPSWGATLLAVVLFLIALVKPTLVAPFFWMALLVPATLVAGALIVVGYLALTAFAVSFQTQSPIAMVSHLLNHGLDVAANNGYGNVSFWVARLHLNSLALPASLTVLALLGLWVFRHRRDDVWVLIGVSAILTRLWIYFFFYDDTIIFLALIVLSRIIFTTSPSSTLPKIIAGLLLAADFILVLASKTLFGFITAYLLDLLPTTLFPAYWIAVLVFLLWYAHIFKQNAAKLDNPLTKTG